MSPFNRRTLFAATGALGMAAAAAHQPAAVAAPAPHALRFNAERRFKVIQFNDTQDDHLTDRRTIEFMEKVLVSEKPDFALINGDVIAAGPTTNEQVYQAINNVVLPMEERGIAWAVTFGNHDEDPAEEAAAVTVRKPEMTRFVRQYRHNHNAPATGEGYGVSNTLIPILDGEIPAFALWLLDSGAYLGEEVAGQSVEDLPGYDYLRPAQIRWYEDNSRKLEAQAGAVVPGLMYFHIPTYEHRDMWFGGPDKNSLIDHGKAKQRHQIVGEKNEDVYKGAFNSGIYAAVANRGDVKGIYCGHDHINTYKGNYFGVELGYAPGTGFGPYGLRDGTLAMHTLRGARVFELNLDAPEVYESTRVIFAKDLGLDMAPAKQPLDAPKALPDYLSTVDEAKPDEGSSRSNSSSLSSGSSW
ncbi:metallophosphoesterase family protein [Corynebacterium sp. 32222D000AT]|uniref:metallophosphoesterase family protein n=1 Tax=Corynebacterium sp. LK2522 TaxID=3110474 RepID=UPI0034CF2E18